MFAARAVGSYSTMPWGKHKGTPLKDVPRDYLLWVLREADKAAPELKAEIQQVLDADDSNRPLFSGDDSGDPQAEEIAHWQARYFEADKRAKAAEAKALEFKRQASAVRDNRVRELEALLRAATQDRPTDADKFRRIIKRWYGAMSRKYHPDLGGSAERQTVVNDCYRGLAQLIEGEQGS